MKQDKKDLAAKIKKLNIGSIAIILFYLGLVISIIIYGNYKTFEKFEDSRGPSELIGWITAFAFLFLGIVFFWASYSLIGTLKSKYNEFYISYRRLLWTATIVLTVPLPLRTLLDLMKNWTWWTDIT